MSSSVQLPHGGCHTHRTPSGAGRSAAWPRTPTGSTRRCATSWGSGGGRLRAAGRWARADGRAGGHWRRVPGFSGGSPARKSAGAAWATGAPRQRPQGAGRRWAGTTAGRTDPPPPHGRLSAGGCGPQGAPTPSSLRRARDAAPGDPGGGRMRFHGGHHAPV